MSGLPPNKTFYIAMMVPNADGTMEFCEVPNMHPTYESAKKEADAIQASYGGQTYVYRCTPIYTSSGSELANAVLKTLSRRPENEMARGS